MQQIQGLFKGLTVGQRQRRTADAAGPQSPPDVMLSSGRPVRTAPAPSAEWDGASPLMERYLSERVTSPTTVAAMAAGAAALLHRAPSSARSVIVQGEDEEGPAVAKPACTLPRRHSMGGPLPTPRAIADGGPAGSIRTVRLSSPSRCARLAGATRRHSIVYQVLHGARDSCGGYDRGWLTELVPAMQTGAHSTRQRSLPGVHRRGRREG